MDMDTLNSQASGVPHMGPCGNLCAFAAAILVMLAWPLSGTTQGPKAQFVGSGTCKGCHAAAYNGWAKTRMANVVLDPKLHPEAVLGDFTHPDPLRTFGIDEIALVYGSRYKQRYFVKRGDDYFPMPAQWDIAKKRWLPYHVEPGTDWWVPFYGPTNFDRPTGPTCDGCHSVNYNLETKEVTEWNVGCEKCHGPGSLHVAHPHSLGQHRESRDTRPASAAMTYACSATPRASR